MTNYLTIAHENESNSNTYLIGWGDGLYVGWTVKNGWLASDGGFAVFATVFWAMFGGGAAAATVDWAMNGFACSFVPPKLNGLAPNPVVPVLPNKPVIVGFGCWLPIFDRPKLGFACIGGGLAGVEVAPVSGIANVKLFNCWKSAEDGVFAMLVNDWFGGVYCAAFGGALFSIAACLNHCNPDWSPRFCGGEQMSTRVGWKFSKSKLKRNPCVDKMCSIGITGIWFSPNTFYTIQRWRKYKQFKFKLLFYA